MIYITCTHSDVYKLSKNKTFDLLKKYIKEVTEFKINFCAVLPCYSWRRKWQPTPVFLPGESQGWGSLVGCCLWGRTEQLNSSSSQYSCLEIPWTGEAWRATVHGVAKSGTQLSDETTMWRMYVRDGRDQEQPSYCFEGMHGVQNKDPGSKRAWVWQEHTQNAQWSNCPEQRRNRKLVNSFVNIFLFQSPVWSGSQKQ